MFVTVLCLIYMVLVLGIFSFYISRQRFIFIRWAQKKGYAKNFFVRILLPTPRGKKEELQKISKIYMH